MRSSGLERPPGTVGVLRRGASAGCGIRLLAFELAELAAQRLRLALESLEVATQVVDALGDMVRALLHALPPRLDLAQLALGLVRSALRLAGRLLRRLARAPLREVVPRRGGRNAGNGPADRVGEVVRFEGAGFERLHQTRGHHGSGGCGIQHRGVDRLLDVVPGRRADGDAGILRELDRLRGEGGDEGSALSAEARELRGVEVVLRVAECAGELERVGELALAREPVDRPRRDGRLAERLDARAEVPIGCRAARCAPP